MLREKLAVEPESVYDYLTKTLIDSIQYSETSKSVSVLRRQTINERTPRDHLEKRIERDHCLRDRTGGRF